MPKTFSDQERDLIRQSMLKVGATLLRKKGIRQVTVEDITKGSNIAKGSFYTFYESREELFWDIIKMEEQQLLYEITEIAEMDLDIKTKVRKIFFDVYLRESSIVFYLPQADIEYIGRKLSPATLQLDITNAQNLNRTILSLCRLDASKESVDILMAMEKLMLFASSDNIALAESARKKVLEILVESIADYLDGGAVE